MLQSKKMICVFVANIPSLFSSSSEPFLFYQKCSICRLDGDFSKVMDGWDLNCSHYTTAIFTPIIGLFILASCRASPVLFKNLECCLWPLKLVYIQSYCNFHVEIIWLQIALEEFIFLFSVDQLLHTSFGIPFSCFFLNGFFRIKD